MFQQQYFQPYQMPDFMRQAQTVPQMQQTPQQQDERIWVSSPAAADAYLMAPNSFVRLWDSSAPVFYEKRSDAAGRPYMEAYEYKRKDMQASPQTQSTPDYSDKIKTIEERLTALERGTHDADKPDGNAESV